MLFLTKDTKYFVRGKFHFGGSRVHFSLKNPAKEPLTESVMLASRKQAVLNSPLHFPLCFGVRPGHFNF